MFDEEPRGETAATKSFFFISIDPFFLRVPVVIFARSLGSLDSRISRVRSLRRSSRARLSRETIECFHSPGQHLCKLIGTKDSVCIRKEFNSHRTGLGHQHGRRFIVLGHQYGRRDVM